MHAADNSLPCSYCGLPTPLTPRNVEEAVREDRLIYCCLGCRIASGIMQSDDPSTGNRHALTRLGLAIFFSMNVMVFTLVLWTWNVRDLPDDSSVNAFRGILRYACFFFSAPVLILLGGPLVESSFDAWHQRRFTTDVLLLIGVCAAYCYSITSLVLGLPDVYFEVACMILVAVTLGKWLEATAKSKATQALRSLRQLLPNTVRRHGPLGEEIIPLDAVRPTDVLRVLAGERIPVDGKIESGCGTIDEQVVTGESIPTSKVAGQVVFSGTLNLDGELLVCATASHDEGTICRLVQAVEEAANAKCHTIRVADQLAAWIVPLVVVSSMAAFWFNSSAGIQDALMASLSVVLIACPCALGIATPLALWVAISSAAQRGVLFRNGDAVTNLARLRSLAFDKTGTVTRGNVRVTSMFVEPGIERGVARIFANAIAGSSNHVLSKAIATFVREDGAESLLGKVELTQIRDHAGKGVSGVLATTNRAGTLAEELSHGDVAMLGNLTLADELKMEVSDNLRSQLNDNSERAAVLIGWAGRVRGVFFLSEELRPETVSVVKSLRRLGLPLVILTGDHSRRARQIEELTGVRAVGELLPEDKVSELRRQPTPVGMVGDGINDAIALAVADVGIAMDCGADVSRDAADVCLMGSTLRNLPWAIDLARAATHAVRRNLVWAVGYNLVGIGFAITGNLNPIIAAIAMVGSSLFVLTNSLRLASTAKAVDDVAVHNDSAAEDTGLAGRSAIDPVVSAVSGATQ